MDFLKASAEFHNLRTKMVPVVEQTFKGMPLRHRAIHIGTMPDNKLSILQCAFKAARRQRWLIHRVIDGARSFLSTWMILLSQPCAAQISAKQACAPRTSQGPLKAMMPLPQPSSESFHLGDGMEKRRGATDSSINTYQR